MHHRVYLPDVDGTTHVNVYSRGKTQAGRLASNFAHTPFYHPTHGRFASIEGLWYWLTSTHRDRDQLRELHGAAAKSLGRQLQSGCWVVDHRAQVTAGLSAKAVSHPEIGDALKAVGLPLTHYYVCVDGRLVPRLDDWCYQWWAERCGLGVMAWPR